MTILLVMFTILSIAALQGVLFLFFGFKKVTYSRHFSAKSAFVGEHITMVEEISNNKMLPISWLKVESRMPRALSFGAQDNLTISSGMYHKSIFFMGAYKKIIRTHYISCVHRGRINLKSAAISAGTFLGFSQMTKDYPLNAQITIYPRLLSFDDIPKLSKQLLGEIIVKRWISPDPFLINGIRSYSYGDNSKDVHWGATAKTGELKMKTKDFSASPNLLVLLNTEISQNQWSIVLEKEAAPIEYGISLAATMLIWAMRNGLKAGFGTNGYLYGDENKNPVYIPQDGGTGGIKNMLETMSSIMIARALTFYTYIDMLIEKKIHGMDIIILSAYMTARLKEQIKRLEKIGNLVHIQEIRGSGVYE